MRQVLMYRSKPEFALMHTGDVLCVRLCGVQPEAEHRWGPQDLVETEQDAPIVNVQ